MRKKIVISGVLILLLAGALGFFCFWRAPEAENVVWGVSFSQKQAAALGLDWQAAYSALLDDLGVKKIRIAAHWDLLALRPGEYDFSDLDWQMDEAARAGAKTVLAIGMKTPRWPECHLPEWAKTLDKERQQAAVLALLEAAAVRYRDHPALESWQVENEPLFPFGECPWRDEKFLQKEIARVKSLDGNKRPVVISDSGEGSWWLNAARAGDIAGVVGLHDVRVVEPAHRFHFSFETCDGTFVGRLFFGEDFHGNDPVQPGVAGLVDRAHPPLAELGQQFVLAQFSREGCLGR